MPFEVCYVIELLNVTNAFVSNAKSMSAAAWIPRLLVLHYKVLQCSA